jgi:putative tricarboxylic transport membrane protein
MLFRKYKELIIGLIVMVFGGLYITQTFSITKYGDAVVDSRFIPQLLGGLLVFLGVIQIINGIKGLSKINETQSQNSFKVDKRVLLTLVNVIVYISLLKSIGFLIMTMAFTILQIIILSNEKKPKYLNMIIISIIFSISIYIIFVKGFSLTLPSGILG